MDRKRVVRFGEAVGVALLSAILSAVPASAQERIAPRFDLGVGGGWSWTSEWFDDTCDGFGLGPAPVFGANTSFWASPDFAPAPDDDASDDSASGVYCESPDPISLLPPDFFESWALKNPSDGPPPAPSTTQSAEPLAGHEPILDEIGDDTGATNTSLPPKPVADPPRTPPPPPPRKPEEVHVPPKPVGSAESPPSATAPAPEQTPVSSVIHKPYVRRPGGIGPSPLPSPTPLGPPEIGISAPLTPDPGALIYLDLHNRERAAVGVPPLQWDPQLAVGAMAYAVQLTNAGQLVHSSREGRKDIRENLLQSLPGQSPEQMIGVWLAEKRHFKPGIFPDVSNTGNWYDVGHYTQMIWETNTRVGCAALGDRRFTWFVCHYSPGGNKDGKPVL